MFVVGFLVDLFIIRRLIGHPHFAVVILTISLGLVIRAIIGAIWGYEPQSIETPFAGQTALFGTSLDNNQLVLIGTTMLLCLILGLFFKTKWGLAIKASSQNQLAAYFVGIPVRRLYSMSWGIGAVVACAAGILLSSTVMIDPHTGLIGIKAFAAAVIGGLGSLPGAMIGGIIVGLIEQLAGSYLPTGSQETSAYIVMLILLFLRPHGLFSQVQLKKA